MSGIIFNFRFIMNLVAWQYHGHPNLQLAIANLGWEGVDFITGYIIFIFTHYSLILHTQIIFIYVVV